MNTPLEDKELRKQVGILFSRSDNAGFFGRSDNITEMVKLIEKERIKARISEVESMGVIAVDSPEILPTLTARISDLENQLNKIEGK